MLGLWVARLELRTLTFMGGLPRACWPGPGVAPSTCDPTSKGRVFTLPALFVLHRGLRHFWNKARCRVNQPPRSSQCPLAGPVPHLRCLMGLLQWLWGWSWASSHTEQTSHIPDVLAVCQAQSAVCPFGTAPSYRRESWGRRHAGGGVQVPALAHGFSQSVFGPRGEWRPPRKRQRLDLKWGRCCE